MSFRSFTPWLIPLLVAVAACETSLSTSDDGSAPVAQAKSSVPRAPASQVPSGALADAVEASNAFAVDLYANLRTGQGTENLLTSPLSASLALTMAYAGAQGGTATQMASTLHSESTAQTLFEGQNVLTQALAGRAAAALAGDAQQATESGGTAPSPSNYQLQVVNSVWGEQTYHWAAPFLDVLAKDYGTGVYLVDFINQFDEARQAINGWVSTQTDDKINDLLPEGSLDPMTRMVLVNAIHLKLQWETAFSASATAPATFTKTGGASLSVPFMNQESTFAYMDDGSAQIVSLPLSGGQVSVVIALPHGDLATYEAHLNADSAALSQPSSYALVSLALPKFTFTSPTFSLKTSLTTMGMPQAFDPDAADFKGLCASTPDGDNLYISDVLQKAMIAVQENGVEAAAATAVIIEGSSGAAGGAPPPTPVPMVVNRPFVMAIVDVPTRAILFLGHIADPSDAGMP
jgi:serpin B